MENSFLLLRGWQIAVLMLLTLIGPVARAQAPSWQSAIAVNASMDKVVADAFGNMYLTGSFSGSAVFGPTTLNSVGGKDIFVAKWNISTNRFVWAIGAGGVNDDQATAIALSGTSLYVAGSFASLVASFGNSTISNPTTAVANLFIAKLYDGGSTCSFAWAQRANGTATALAVNGTNVYVTGYFDASVAYIGSTVLINADLQNRHLEDIFVAKLADMGSSGNFAWALRGGGLAHDAATALVVNGANVYIAGNLGSMPASFGAFSISSAGGYDVFVAKVVDAGNVADFAWAQRAGGPGSDYAQALASEGTNLYLTGSRTSNDVSFGANTPIVSPIYGSVGNLFIAKLTDAGSNGNFTWVASSSSFFGNIAAVTASGTNVFVAGAFGGVAGAFGTTMLNNSHIFTGPPSNVPSFEIFVAKLIDAGATGDFVWALRAGGTDFDEAKTIALRGGRLLVTGYYRNRADFGSYTLANSLGFFASIEEVPLASVSAHLQAELKIFPNPAHGRATIQLPAVPGAATATLTILDALGRTLRTQTAATNTKADLDLTGLAPGLYAVRVAAGGNTATQKLVVE